jgi:hypothetical protein
MNSLYKVDCLYSEMLNNMTSGAEFWLPDISVKVFMRQYKRASSITSLLIYLHSVLVTNKTLTSTPAAFSTNIDCLIKP